MPLVSTHLALVACPAESHARCTATSLSTLQRLLLTNEQHVLLRPVRSLAAQIFEALGLHPDVVRAAFVGTPSRVAGVSFETIGGDALALHAAAYGGAPLPEESADARALPNPGDYMYRSPIVAGQTEAHLNDPSVIFKLQEAAATNRCAVWAGGDVFAANPATMLMLCVDPGLKKVAG